ncbi:hypothetical protein [Brucella sp.]|uniref:hypothetical protein n=1 Tax=Brucella sp. TaxID=52132 RepID=UPI0028AAD11A|nr:hypothetical protein [Brucella sp.]
MAEQFDTMLFAKALVKRGMSSKDAIALAIEAKAHIVDSMATKTDLRTEIANSEMRMTIRIGGMFIVAVTVILAVLPFLLK